jgi:hypothetical protein
MVEILNFISISLACTFATSWLIRKKNFAPVRASSCLTVFAVSSLMLIDMKFGNRMAPVVLGATFVGMSDAERLGYRSLSVASIVFSLIFFFILPYNPGFGGALGLAAFCSCILVYFMKNTLFKKRS